jgi:hypothetical protein
MRIRHMVVFGIKDSNQYLEKMNTTDCSVLPLPQEYMLLNEGVA